MKAFAILLPCVALMTACSGTAGNNVAGNAANGSATAAAPAAPADVAAVGGISIQPGLWEARVTLEGFEMPGAPPGVQEQMKQAMTEQVQQTCYTAEDVANMGRRMFEANEAGTSCEFTNQEVGNGRINVVGTCTSPQANVEMSVQGTHTATTMDTRNIISTTAAGQTMRITATTSSRRVGECPAGAPAATDP